MRSFMLFALTAAMLLTGCTRQHVARPELARDNNDVDWTIRSAPTKTVPSAESVPATGDEPATDAVDAIDDSEEASP